MSVVSIRFSDGPVHDRLREVARRQRVALSTLAERLIDEGLRSERRAEEMEAAWRRQRALLER